MPLPYPYSEPKTTNWPKIILWGLGIIILAAIIIFFIMDPLSLISNKANDFLNNPNGYDCTEDIYNCGNFTTQAEVQAVYDYCAEQGKGDIHQLAADGNGKACESLPLE